VSAGDAGPAGVRLSVVVLSWNTREILRACLAALRREAHAEPLEVIVVDNASSDRSPDMVAAEFPEVRLVRNSENLLFAEGNNQGARLARGRFLCLMNSDIEVRPGALEALMAFLDSHPGHGAVAPKLLNPDGSLQRACNRFPSLLEPLLESTSLGSIPPGPWLRRRKRMADFDHEHSRDVAQPPAACLMLRRDEFLAMDGLDPELGLFFNDVDLCRRLWKRGRRIHYLAEAEVLHHQGASTRVSDRRGSNVHWFRNRTAYYRKHHGRLAERWLRAVLRIWGWECGLRIRLGPREAPAKRAALDELREMMRQCLAR